MHACIYTCVVYIYIYVYICVHIHIYMYVFMHTCIYTYIFLLIGLRVVQHFLDDRDQLRKGEPVLPRQHLRLVVVLQRPVGFEL